MNNVVTSEAIEKQRVDNRMKTIFILRDMFYSILLCFMGIIITSICLKDYTATKLFSDFFEYVIFAVAMGIPAYITGSTLKGGIAAMFKGKKR